MILGALGHFIAGLLHRRLPGLGVWPAALLLQLLQLLHDIAKGTLQARALRGMFA